MLGRGGEGLYLHDGLREVLGAPVAQSRLHGGADEVPVPARLVAVVRGLPMTQAGTRGHTRAHASNIQTTRKRTSYSLTQWMLS